MSEDMSASAKDNIDRSQVFAVYNVYRLVIGSVLFALTISSTESVLVSDETSMQIVAAGILVVTSLIIATLGPGSKLTSESGIFGVMMIDVVATTLIADPSTVMATGFTALYFVTVAAASILLQNRQLSTLVAALTVMATLANTVFHLSRGDTDSSDLLYAGLRGALLFAVCWLGQITSATLVQAEQRAAVATTQVRRLKLFNDQIVEHMQTGILIVSPSDGLRPVNSAARDLLLLDSGSERPAHLIDLQLAVALADWREGDTLMPSPFKPERGHRTLLPRFTGLDTGREGDALLFVDDYTPMTQFAQSLKLNSLGRLTGSIAHEIRNPLAAVSNAVQLLVENKDLNDSDSQLASIVLRNTNRMNDTVNSVLELSRRVPPNVEPIEVSGWLTEVLRDFKESHAKSATLSIKGKVDAPIVADKGQMKRVLENLIDNALRHSEVANGERTASIEISRSSAARLCFIDVIDDGEGVSEAAQARLFEPFFTTTPEGTGLGLYLCKELCESNGADINYRRTADGRSSFRLSMRLQPEDTQ
jgi:two-component system sensor histidine kinase PilS (NtrC family)